MNSIPRYFYAVLLLWTVIATHCLQAQNGQNPYQERLNWQPAMRNYEQAEMDLKNGKPVTVLSLNDYVKPLGAPLAQFADVEQVFIYISRSDSATLTALFEELSRLPKLKADTSTNRENPLRYPLI
jgi:hypothetical protein